jgi:hypothetical protein
MPRFHFNIYDGYSQPDPTGTEFPNWHAARLEALRLAGAILADEAEQISFEKGWHLEVTDEWGLVLFRFDFTAFSAAAVGCES